VRLQAQGPPPFVPRRPRVETDSGDQGRFKRINSAAAAKREAEFVSNATLDAGGDAYQGSAAAAAVSALDGLITMEQADMQPPQDDKHDPLGFAKRFGITRDTIITLDKEVRMCRFNPTEVMTERVKVLEERLRNENLLGSRGIADVLYRNGARAIWILPKGGFFYGPEAEYLERMRARTVQDALKMVTPN
jgi:hypothetical protein